MKDPPPATAAAAVGRPGYRVLGIPVHDLTMKKCLELADQFLAAGGPHTVIAINPEKVIRATRDPRLRSILETSDLLIPDGIGVVYAVRMRRGRLEQVGGVDLMAHMVAKAAATGVPIFFLGAREEVNAAAVANLRERYPGLQVAGRAHGFFSEAEEEALVDRINASGAKILFLALGSPKQEYWMAAHRARLAPRWIQGVGGSFDVFGKHMPRAPRWLYRIHLEWLFRLIVDWRRLPRYWGHALFAFSATLEALGLYRPRPD